MGEAPHHAEARFLVYTEIGTAALSGLVMDRVMLAFPASTALVSRGCCPASGNVDQDAVSSFVRIPRGFPSNVHVIHGVQTGLAIYATGGDCEFRYKGPGPLVRVIEKCPISALVLKYIAGTSPGNHFTSVPYHPSHHIV